MLLLCGSFSALRAQCDSPANRCDGVTLLAQLTADTPYPEGTATDYFAENTTIAGTPPAIRVTITFTDPSPAATLDVSVSGGAVQTLDASGDQIVIGSGAEFDFTVNALMMGQVAVTFEVDVLGTFTPVGGTTIVVGAPLPVRWASPLAAAPSGKALRLSWSVSDQVDVARYVVESSTGGQRFADAESVPPRPGSGEVGYTATVAAPATTTYYRIRQYDYDGRSSLSNTVVVGPAAAGALRLFPNPARGEVNLRAGGDITGLALYDPTGRRVLQRSGPTAALALPDLPAGVYTLAVRLADGERVREKLVIR